MPRCGELLQAGLVNPPSVVPGEEFKSITHSVEQENLRSDQHSQQDGRVEYGSHEKFEDYLLLYSEVSCVLFSFLLQCASLGI